MMGEGEKLKGQENLHIGGNHGAVAALGSEADEPLLIGK
jgi:hypothetical protein